MEYKLSNTVVHSINYAIVFCPKRRSPVLVDEIVEELRVIISKELAQIHVKIESLSIQPDHVSLFVSSPPNISPHQIVKSIKGGSSKKLREMFPQLKKLPALWSRSYYAGSVGFVSESVIKSYIESQKGK